MDAYGQPEGCSSKQDVADAQPHTVNSQQQLMAVLKHMVQMLTDEHQDAYTYLCDYLTHYDTYQAGICSMKLVSLHLNAIFGILNLIFVSLRNLAW
jgi:hypothetical protein